ncbi:MAG: DUF2313 domain-containing protein [Oscillospiraceae bacterium]|nr:DUF2313 domain-containing protein [Oscillospiraceae bacterium]
MTEARDHVPAYYYDDPNTAAVLMALDRAGERFLAAVEDHLRQLDVRTATWGLPLWESRYGIKPNMAADYDGRRSTVMARMRSAGTTTVAMIQNLAASYSNGEVDVIEYPDQFRIEIKFVNTVGTPSNIEDLTAELRACLPAHLEWGYIITYVMWSQLNTKTWDELSGRTWVEVKESM